MKHARIPVEALGTTGRPEETNLLPVNPSEGWVADYLASVN
jgi:hypothetical protein